MKFLTNERSSAPLRACAAGGVLLALLLGTACSRGPEPEAAPAAVRASNSAERSGLPVRGYRVEPRTLERRVDVAGTVAPLQVVALAARTDGVLDEVRVEEGDRVVAGQLLARIDVREQSAELARAQAGLREAQSQLDRLLTLRERGFVDAAAVISAQSAQEVAASTVQLWRTRVESGRIEAPLEGYVIRRMIEPGASIGRLAPAFELADLDRLVLRVGISELDAAGLAAGDPVPVRVDALPGAEPLDARIRRIAPTADAASRLVMVEIELPQAFAAGVRPGYLARASLLVDVRAEALAVPAGAVGLSGSAHVMRINEAQRLERREVELGVVRGDWREIRSGLAAGEVVLATSPLEMAVGEQVRVVEWLEAQP
ncbi:MAG: efflux RND transporter periplasmic adaptor subunit [Aquimonas sp.]|nr:efflux RND transporter periplasmic adaptor subunit [Aquimonas sp.]